MKSVNFKRQGADIRVMSDKGPVKSRRQWDRIIYFIVFFSLIGWVGYYIFTRNFYVRADSHVLYENVNVRLLKDCRIMEYYVDEDHEVKFGDTLFRYIENAPEQGYDVTAEIQAPTSNNDNPAYQWVVREILNTEQRIAVNETHIDENQSLIKTYQNELKEIQAMVQLGVMPQSRLDLRNNEIIKLKSDISRIEEENKKLRTSIENLRAKIPAINQDYKKNFRLAKEGIAEDKYFVSPFDGSVNRIYIRQFETCLKSEITMSIHRVSPIFVRAYFQQEDIDYLKVGDEFTVEFPNGKKTVGILKRFYYSTIPLPEEYQKRYEPTTRSLAGDIYPKDTTEAKEWESYYKMGALVTRFKY
ncbi:MAG: hypothetical protein RL062_1301 [Bacteroidota bacterium]